MTSFIKRAGAASCLLVIGTAGDLLTIQITHVDPANYRDPLIVTITYPRTKFELMHYGCDPKDAQITEPSK